MLGASCRRVGGNSSGALEAEISAPASQFALEFAPASGAVVGDDLLEHDAEGGRSS
jgi:hypothetical protein